MPSKNSVSTFLTSTGFVAGVATGFVLALGVLVGAAALVGQNFIEGVGTEGGPPAAASLEVPSLPDTTASTYGTVPESWSLQAVTGGEVAEGDTTTFAALQGGPVVLNVWATWCQPCRAELPILQALHDSTGSVVLVSTEAPSTARPFLNQSGYSMPAYVTDQLPSVLDGRAVPRTYLLSPKGRIVHRHLGAADWARPSTYAFLRQLQGDGREDVDSP